MKSILILVLANLVCAAGYSQSTQELGDRADAAASIVNNFEVRSDAAIPESLLKMAKCVATVPNVLRAGFIFGASYGQGLVSCRTAKGWSDPVFISVLGGSWGWQAGIESTDLVMVFVDPNAVNRVSNGNFTIGGDATVAAGPLGRDAQAGTDYQLKAQILTYSHSQGLFAGLTLNGTAYQIEHNADAVAYGNKTAHQIVTTYSRSPGIAAQYVDSLDRYAR